MQIQKYPRTQHLQGSRLQPGDEDLDQISIEEIRNCHVVVEEKVDGANAAVSFDEQGQLQLQSRGHYLTGGYRERHFALFKTWASCHQGTLFEILGQRYIMYGEWLYARHTIYYDRLPHYFLEFDIYDKESCVFLDTPSRHEMLAGSPVVSVPVLYSGTIHSLKQLTDMVGPERYQSDGWQDDLIQKTKELGLNTQLALSETDLSGQMEGLYLKIEENGLTTGRLKWVRAAFHSAVAASGSHWLDRPIIPNGLAPGVDIYGS